MEIKKCPTLQYKLCQAEQTPTAGRAIPLIFLLKSMSEREKVRPAERKLLYPLPGIRHVLLCLACAFFLFFSFYCKKKVNGVRDGAQS